MPTTTINPNGDGQGGTDFAALADSNDATFVEPGGYPTFSRRIDFSTFSLPAGAAVVSANVRARLAKIGGLDSRARAYYNLSGVGYQTLTQVSPTASIAEFDMGTVTAAHTQAQVDAIDVQISDEVNGGVRWYKLWIDVKYASAPSAPTGVIASPTNTRRPGITFTHVPGADSVGGQSGFQVRIFSAAQYGAGGFDPATSPATYDSGVQTIPTSTWSVPSSSPLANGTTYRVYVRTYQTTNGVMQASPFTFYQWTVSISVPTPSAVTPAQSTTATSSRPAVGANVGAMSDGVLIKREWDVASDSSFTINKQTITETTVGLTKSGTYAFPAALNRLPQGVWWIRARTIDEYGQASGYTAAQSFTIAHQPTTTNRQPSGGLASPYATSAVVSWSFSDIDTTDSQTKYEAEMWVASNPSGTTKTTGQVTSTANQATFTGLTTTYKNVELRWRVRVADLDGVWSDWSTEQAFYLRDLPVATIVAPANGGTVTNAQPTITWTFSSPGGMTQASYRVVVTSTASGQVVADSGVVAGTALSWEVPSPVVLVGQTYTVTLTLVDSAGLTGVDTNSFSATYAAPTTPVFTVDGSNYDEDARVHLDWSSSTKDSTFQFWRVYRRIEGENSWTLVADLLDQLYFDDYLAPSDTPVEYSVVQIALSFGEPVESGYPVMDFQAENTHYYLICPEDTSLNTKLRSVVADSFSDEQEMAHINLIGRGRRVEYGTRYGQQGSLTAQLRNDPEITARGQRIAIEMLRNSQLKVYLRNPFGDVWAVALNSAQFTRVPGTGLHEAVDVTIDYAEITA